MYFIDEIEEIKQVMDRSILKRMYLWFWNKYEFGGYARVSGRLCYKWTPKI